MFSDSFDVNRERDFIEVVDEIIHCVLSCGFWNSGAFGPVMLLMKPPEPSASKLQDPTRKVVPLVGTGVLSKEAIEFLW